MGDRDRERYKSKMFVSEREIAFRIILNRGFSFPFVDRTFFSVNAIYMQTAAIAQHRCLCCLLVNIIYVCTAVSVMGGCMLYFGYTIWVIL